MRFVFYCNSQVQIFRMMHLIEDEYCCWILHLAAFISISRREGHPSLLGEPAWIPCVSGDKTTFSSSLLHNCLPVRNTQACWLHGRCCGAHQFTLFHFVVSLTSTELFLLKFSNECIEKALWLLMQGHRNGISWQNSHPCLHMLSQIRNICENAEPGELGVTSHTDNYSKDGHINTQTWRFCYWRPPSWLAQITAVPLSRWPVVRSTELHANLRALTSNKTAKPGWYRAYCRSLTDLSVPSNVCQQPSESQQLDFCNHKNNFRRTWKSTTVDAKCYESFRHIWRVYTDQQIRVQMKQLTEVAWSRTI